jgi:hypothetical protein
MTPIINPTLLQLVALGVKDDHYLHDGRHLRWTFSPKLGFPRSGFQLLRRSAPLPWDPKRENVKVRRAPMADRYIKNGQLRHPYGVHVTAERGTLQPAGDGGIAVGSDRIRIRFTEDSTQHAASTPACWVLIRYRHNPNGSIAATAVHREGDRTHIQDRGANGQNLEDVVGRLVNHVNLDTLRNNIRSVGGVPNLPTATENSLDPSQRGVGDTETGSSGYRIGKFLLNGSVIDEVLITGRGAELEGVEWITIQDYADANDWELVDFFHLPIDGDGITYPKTNRQGGKTVARDRLEHAPPKALGPWASPQWPPAQVGRTEIEGEHLTPYLDTHPELAKGLHSLVREEIEEAIPQRSIQVEEKLMADEQRTPDENTRFKLNGSKMSVPLLEMIQAAAIDPGMARMLGLMTTDLDADREHVDYLLKANWWTPWVRSAGAPWYRARFLEHMAENRMDEYGRRLPLPSRDTTWGDSADSAWSQTINNQNFTTVISVATNVTVEPRDAPDPPEGLSGKVRPQTAISDVPAVVKLSWPTPQSNLFTESGHVAFALRRLHDGNDISLVRTDPDSGVPLPQLPATADSSAGFTDRAPEMGECTYRVSGMDLWGRWSDFVETTVKVRDEIAPPTPTGIEARLLGNTGPRWDLEITFKWTAGQQALAPDLNTFRFLCEQGKVSRKFTAWDRCEMEPDQRSELTISWPDMEVTTPLTGVTAKVESMATEDRGSPNKQVTVTIPNVQAAYGNYPLGSGQSGKHGGDQHRARISVSVVAIDDDGNESDPARRMVAERVDPAEPSPEPLAAEPQVATWPDAERKCYWVAEWSTQPDGSRTQVLRAAQARLLTAAGESFAEFEKRDTSEQIQRLREIAKNNRLTFSPDHEEPYDTSSTRHQVALPAEDRGYTVVTVRHTGPTGTLAPWPTQDDRFAVVRLPPTTPPPTPSLSTAGDLDEVRLTVAPDPSGVTQTVRLYRTPYFDAVEDIRRMRPLTPRSGDTTNSIKIQDPVPPDRWYAYRAVAMAASGLQSDPTAPAWVRADTNRSPMAPTIEAIKLDGGGSPERRLSIRVQGYGLSLRLERRPIGIHSWTRLQQKPISEFPASGSASSPSTKTLTVTNRPPSGTEGLRVEYRAVVIDRRGQSASSQPVFAP